MFYSGLFYSGLILFFGIHLVPMFSNVRKYIVEKTGENAYRGIFSLVSLGGFFLIIFGYQSSDDFLYDSCIFIFGIYHADCDYLLYIFDPAGFLY